MRPLTFGREIWVASNSFAIRTASAFIWTTPRTCLSQSWWWPGERLGTYYLDHRHSQMKPAHHEFRQPIVQWRVPVQRHPTRGSGNCPLGKSDQIFATDAPAAHPDLDQLSRR